MSTVLHQLRQHWLWTGAALIVLCMVLTVTTAFWPSPKNLAHVLALSAAALVGVQFWYADQGGVYVLSSLASPSIGARGPSSRAMNSRST